MSPTCIFGKGLVFTLCASASVSATLCCKRMREGCRGGDDWRVGCADEPVDWSFGALGEVHLEGEAAYCTSFSLKSTGSLMYEFPLKSHGLPESEVRCELRAHRRMSLGRGF